MKSKLIWLTAPLAVTVLLACDPAEEDTGTDGGTTTTGGDTATSVLALGSGSGSSFNAGTLTAAIGSSDLSAGGSTTVSATVVDTNSSNALYTNEVVDVTFTSACIDDGKASLSSSEISTATGTATVTYQAEGCVGNDTIVATATDPASSSTLTATVTIAIATADVNAISFTGTDFASSIAYSNASNSNLPSFSKIEFQLYDANGYTVEGQAVNFTLSSVDDNSGVSLSVSSDTSDEEGLVSVILNAGAAAANVRVLASFTSTGGTDISTQSPPVAVNTGPVDVDSFSLSISDASVASAYNVNGKTTQLSVYLGDRHNNPVADGTVVSFWTEYGFIEPSCETSGGACSVTWTSSGTRPIDGLSTVVAYSTGEDSFIDAGQKNGIYNISGEVGLTANEAIISTSELYYDLNYDGYTSTSFTDAGSGLSVASDRYSDYNNSGSFDASSALYRGALCSDGAVTAGHCAETSIRIWDQSQLALNTLTPKGSVNTQAWTAGSSYTVTVTDFLSNFPPAGTTLTFVAVGDADAKIIVDNAVPSVGESGKSGFVFAVHLDSVTTAGYYRVVVSFPGGDTVTIDTVSVN